LLLRFPLFCSACYGNYVQNYGRRCNTAASFPPQITLWLLKTSTDFKINKIR